MSDPSDSQPDEPTSSFKRIFSQVIATLAFGNLIFSNSLICAMPTIFIGENEVTNRTSPEVSSNQTGDSQQRQQPIPITEHQATWFAMIVFLVQPIGSLLSGFIQDRFGRRRCMMGVTVPQFVSWFILYFARNFFTACLATVIMGLSIGFMEAPAKSFLGEVNEPRYRGVLSTFAEIFLLLGIMYEFAVGAMFEWRNSLLASAIIPFMAFFSISIVPESPTWLLQKGRYEDAEAALCWLRGWTRPELVKAEFYTLMDSLGVKPSKEQIPLEFDSQETKKDDKVTAVSQLKYLKESRVYVPIILSFGYFFIGHCVSLLGLRPFLVSIFAELDMPITPHNVLVATSTLQLAGSVACAITIRFLGKRIVSFVSLAGCTVCCLLLALYYHLDPRISSVPLVLFSLLNLSAGYGVVPIPWIILCEIFPADCRGMPLGIVSAWYYLSAAFILKTYVELRDLLGMSVVLVLYSCVGIIGSFFLYYLLPETEGKSLAEVELFFNKEKRRLVQQNNPDHE